MQNLWWNYLFLNPHQTHCQFRSSPGQHISQAPNPASHIISLFVFTRHLFNLVSKIYLSWKWSSINYRMVSKLVINLHCMDVTTAYGLQILFFFSFLILRHTNVGSRFPKAWVFSRQVYQYSLTVCALLTWTVGTHTIMEFVLLQLLVKQKAYAREVKRQHMEMF